MVNASEMNTLAIRGLNLILLLLILGVLFRYAYHAYLRYQRGALYDLEQKEKSEAKRIASLSDDELIDEANKALGLRKKPPTN